MPHPDSNALIEKAHELAEKLGKGASLVSDPGVSAEYFSEFRSLTERVHLRYERLVTEVGRQKHLTHEIESIFDNFFVIEAAIFEIQNNLRKKDFVRLPLSRSNRGKASPRLYYILSRLTDETDKIVDKDIVKKFLSSYQEYSPLSVRELYAIPTVLQIIFVEHFGKLIERALGSLKEYEEANLIAKRIKREAGKNGFRDFTKIVSELASRYAIVPLSLGFYLFQRLSPDSQAMRPVLRWLKLNFEKQGINIKDIAELESKQKNANLVSSSNIIESLHWLTQARWENIVEEINVVDSILSKDPASAYSIMDTESKNSYRQVIVRIAEIASIHEAEVARAAVRLAQQGGQAGGRVDSSAEPPAEAHVGFYLVDKGRETLEGRVGYKPTLSDRFYRAVKARASRYYLGTALAFNLIFTVLIAWLVGRYDIGLVPFAAVTAFVFFLNTEVSLGLLNVLVTRFFPVRRLPEIDLSKGISARQRTFVVVPTMLRSIESVRETVRKLEVRYLGNPQDNLLYALLFDFRDAQQETLPNDTLLVEEAMREIAALNARYSAREKKFHAFYRARKWNEKEGLYMGWERKRGKLREFNMLLRGARGTTYVNEEAIRSLPHVRYVITLDEDTELPLDSARKLVGCIDHPLNRPVLGRGGKSLVRGYGIVQPRVGVRLAVANRSIFSKLFSSNSGIDSYSTAVSDVYQDLFGNAIFFGKGIYDVDAVEKTMEGEIPDNVVLSHDLLEGIYARVGYASSIVLFDGFPKFYHEFIIRHHRWIRGDWQIVRWVFKGRQFAAIDHFKIFDNLRRSLIPVFGIAVLVAGYLSSIPLWYLSLYLILVFVSGSIVSLVRDVLSIKATPFVTRAKDTLRQVAFAVTHLVLRAAFLLHHALVAAGAVLVTLWRLGVSKKHLLQWQNSTDVGVRMSGRLSEYFRDMRVPLAVAAALILGMQAKGDTDAYAFAWGYLWIAAPFIAYLMCLRSEPAPRIKESDRRMLRSIAYRTSHYFLSFSRKEGNWLVPDHHQEFPKIVGSPKQMTSPTNLGMSLLSLLSSYHFGFMPIDRYLDHTRKVLDGIKKLPLFRGHLYNWYDIERLEPMPPRYVSTVDSANFIVSLIALRQGVEQISEEPISGKTAIDASLDALRCFVEELDALSRRNEASRRTVSRLKAEARLARKALIEMPEQATLSGLYATLVRAHETVMRIERSAGDLRLYESAGAYRFAGDLYRLVERHLEFVRYLLPNAAVSDAAIRTYVQRDPGLLEAYRSLIQISDKIPSLDSLSGPALEAAEKLNFPKIIGASDVSADSKLRLLEWYDGYVSNMRLSQERARDFLNDIRSISDDCNRLIQAPDFTFLYDTDKGLFRIGLNAVSDKPGEEHFSKECYNMLASESVLVSFVAIYKGQAPQKHWFHLSRKLVRAGGDIALVSWGGSLFEYLTSLLFFKAHGRSLLGRTAAVAVQQHQWYGFRKSVPWGIGESAYWMFDEKQQLQYKLFGDPTLSLKPDTADFLVVAPYTTALALEQDTPAAVRNMRRLTNIGARGTYGFYDAVDYMGGKHAMRPVHKIVPIYYAHHQGFTLLAIQNLLQNGKIRELFHADPRVASLEILLEEKMPATPAATTLSAPSRLPFSSVHGVSDNGSESRRYMPIKTPYPHLALLGNGAYSVSVSNAGGGFSSYKNISLTRYLDDQLLEESGPVFYIRSGKARSLWSPTIRPFGTDLKKGKVIFHENKAEFHSSNGSLHARLEVTVDPTLAAEIRILTVANNGETAEKVEVASYGEVSLATRAQEMHHPLFQKMLVSSTFVKELNAIIYSRPHPMDRTRTIYFAHMLAKEGVFGDPVSPCADRDIFIGRGRSLRDPAIFDRAFDAPVKRYTLDPIFSIARETVIKPGESARFAYINAASEDIEDLLKILRKYRKGGSSTAAMSRSLAKSAHATRELGITQEMSVIFQDFASKALGGRHRLPEEAPSSELPYIHSLWKLGVSGDYPIVVMRIGDVEYLQSVKYALLCHNYWKHKGIQIDLVILNEEPASYIKVLDDEIDFLIRQSRGAQAAPSGGSVYHVKADLAEEADRKALLYTARAVLDSKNGTLTQQIKAAFKTPSIPKYPARHAPSLRGGRTTEFRTAERSLPENVEFKNGWGGFDAEASEYIIKLSSESLTPAPWANIIAQQDFGTVVTESGSMFTWSKDSYDNRITAWNNDPVAFRSSEIFYLRDEETGEVWNPTPLPVRTKGQFIVRHGKGYTVFEHSKGALHCKFEVSVSLSHPVKLAVLSVRNSGKKRRIISETAYLEPAMAAFRDHGRDFISFERDSETGALFFSQKYRSQLPGRTAFADLCSGSFDATSDRAEFLGRHGQFEAPAALKRAALSNHLSSGTSSCAALQAVISLEPGEEKEVIFMLGEVSDKAVAREIIKSYRSPDVVRSAQVRSGRYWQELSGTIQIKTPDKTLDALFNHQLLHQAVSSRMWGKTGLYQPSGAFGFRDQLQDVLSLVWSRPADVRTFILKAAAHQFKEGDALGWWHDYNGFGSRSVLSDHQLWLVYATLEYMSVTGDASILDEKAPFLEGPRLTFAREQEWAGVPTVLEESAPLYEHCVRAIEKSMVFGEHGLPLIGRSDWNDGLSNVGVLGKGESVWTGWFLGHIAGRFSEIAKKRGDVERAKRYAECRSGLLRSLDKHAWDGRWYRRAFLDSGIPIGSKRLDEFKIDSVAQSWSVLSGMARPERASKAMESAFDELFDGSAMKLLSPALDKSPLDPGYVKDYPPGVRENGSQYNHAALWAAQAMFKMGDSDKGMEILGLVNPFRRSDSQKKASEYRVEPYVVASDVYAEPSYKGRGGWTWYTGSAGVMYRTVVRNVIGLVVEGEILSFDPSLPSEWPGCSVTYKKGSTEYRIAYEKPVGTKGRAVEVHENGSRVPGGKIRLIDDGLPHDIRVTIGTDE